MTGTMTSWDLFEDLREAQDELPQAARDAAGSPASICHRDSQQPPRPRTDPRHRIITSIRSPR